MNMKEIGKYALAGVGLTCVYSLLYMERLKLRKVTAERVIKSIKTEEVKKGEK